VLFYNTVSRGGVAQLGEHLPCKQGVSGSIPLISTILGAYNLLPFLIKNLGLLLKSCIYPVADHAAKDLCSLTGYYSKM
jgi:hypothetical protein